MGNTGLDPPVPYKYGDVVEAPHLVGYSSTHPRSSSHPSSSHHSDSIRRTGFTPSATPLSPTSFFPPSSPGGGGRSARTPTRSRSRTHQTPATPTSSHPLISVPSFYVKPGKLTINETRFVSTRVLIVQSTASSDRSVLFDTSNFGGGSGSGSGSGTGSSLRSPPRPRPRVAGGASSYPPPPPASYYSKKSASVAGGGGAVGSSAGLGLPSDGTGTAGGGLFERLNRRNSGVLYDMIFGTAPVVSEETQTKVHWIPCGSVSASESSGGGTAAAGVLSGGSGDSMSKGVISSGGSSAVVGHSGLGYAGVLSKVFRFGVSCDAVEDVVGPLSELDLPPEDLGSGSGSMSSPSSTDTDDQEEEEGEILSSRSRSRSRSHRRRQSSASSASVLSFRSVFGLAVVLSLKPPSQHHQHHKERGERGGGGSNGSAAGSASASGSGHHHHHHHHHSSRAQYSSHRHVSSQQRDRRRQPKQRRGAAGAGGGGGGSARSRGARGGRSGVSDPRKGSSSQQLVMSHDSAIRKFEKKAHWLRCLLFSHFGIVNVQLQKIVNDVTIALSKLVFRILKRLKKAGRLRGVIHEGYVNVHFPEDILLKNSSVLRSVRDFSRFIDSFMHSQRLARPLWYERAVFEAIHEPPLEEQRTKISGTGLRLSSPRVFETFRKAFIKVLGRKSGSGSKKNARPLKGYNRFLCSVFSAVFSHHLSWTLPFVESTSTSSEEEGGEADPVEAGSVPTPRRRTVLTDEAPQECAAKDHLWSIYGAPRRRHGNCVRRFCRVLVVGTEPKPMRDMLTVLSFFLRCDSIRQRRFVVDPQSTLESQDGLLRYVEIVPASGQRPNSGPDSSRTARGAQKRRRPEPEQDPSTSTQSKTDALPPVVPHPVSKTKFLSSLSFGYSLFCDVVSKYCGALVLSGLPKSADYFEDTIAYLKMEMQQSQELDLSHVIVVDIADLMCNIITARRSPENHVMIDFHEALPTPFVGDVIHKLFELMRIRMEDDQCEHFLNMKLKELAINAGMLVELLQRLLKDKKSRRRSGDDSDSESDSLSLAASPPTITDVDLSRELKMSSADLQIVKHIVESYRKDLIDLIVPNSLERAEG